MVNDSRDHGITRCSTWSDLATFRKGTQVQILQPRLDTKRLIKLDQEWPMLWKMEWGPEWEKKTLGQGLPGTLCNPMEER